LYTRKTPFKLFCQEIFFCLFSFGFACYEVSPFKEALVSSKKYCFCNLVNNRVDQLMMAKTTRFKTRRWPMSVLAYQLDTARVNARTIALIKQVT